MTTHDRRAENVIGKTAKILLFSAVLAMPTAKLNSIPIHRTANQVATIIELHNHKNKSPLSKKY